MKRLHGPYGTAPPWIQFGAAGPVLVWAFLAPTPMAAAQDATEPFLSWTFAPLSIGALVMLVAGYAIAAVSLGCTQAAPFWWNAPFWIAGAVLCAFLLHLGATLGQSQSAATLAVLAPLWVIGAQVLHSTLYAGLRWTAADAELDREWLARLSGEKLVPALA